MNKFTKKIISYIIVSVLFFACGFNLVGCKDEMKTSTDGTFKFFWLGDNQFDSRIYKSHLWDCRYLQ